MLCLIYARTGSLYPCIALHCANNSVAFGASQDWTWQIPVLFAGSIAVIGLAALAVHQSGRRARRPPRRRPPRDRRRAAVTRACHAPTCPGVRDAGACMRVHLRAQ